MPGIDFHQILRTSTKLARRGSLGHPHGKMSASPEIELPRGSELGIENPPQTPGIATFPVVDSRRSSDPAFDSTKDQENEKYESQEEDMTDNDLSVDTSKEEIVWRYLTFETELPHPTSLLPSIHPTAGFDHGPPPEPPNLVKYTNPFDWSEKRKDFTIWVACAITALTAYAAGSYTPGVAQMSAEWGVSNVAVLVGITTFTTGMSPERKGWKWVPN